ncbi:Alpha-amylase/alpha-mannosidase, GH57 family [Ectothiorhodospira marina]|uniref:Alpha-amylase/alpha-mannosidase, GH57 family n=2 Tax=Ectothiorhodospira marina TaxID=1396821 RepID=A0A1H7GAD5_9GAMM|nr:Alpha-amylase/alpha-mannosidase, GH57 family [Ectothiorhodospira marina]
MAFDPSNAAHPPLRVVLCWHMHQPQYLDAHTGEYALPWTYLHAIKDYVDMAAHLEAEPGARAVVNFAPILLDQIEDYARQVRAFLKGEGQIHDPVLALLVAERPPGDASQRLNLAEACTRANRQRLIEPFGPYRLLADMVTWLKQHPDYVSYQGDHFFFDLVTWYHLVWLGETVRRTDPRIQPLMKQGRDFTLAQRRQLLEVIEELLDGLLGRYRRLAESGRVELSFTPYAHPIMPLMLDMESAHEAAPQAELPQSGQYPDGRARVQWHLQRGLESFERHFGRRPAGCWPSEGSVSDATLTLLDEAGIRWSASGEGVLTHSLKQGREEDLPDDRHWLYQPYRFQDRELSLFFRDDGLSDSIGFRYTDWHGDDAVGDFVHHLEEIGQRWHRDSNNHGRGALVTVILDGENAWEYYPANGYYFLSALYRRLAAHTDIELATFSDCLNARPQRALEHVVAGSWVYGNFDTWVGSRDKNRGWEMLIQAKQIFDEVMSQGQLTPAQAEAATLQLAVCEGSDWCWWFGDYNPSGTVSLFERLYRQHLVHLYRLLGKTPPEELSHVLSRGSGEPAAGGVMRQGQKSDG